MASPITRKTSLSIIYALCFLLLPSHSYATVVDDPEAEILFITSDHSDTKYTYNNITTFVDTYRQLDGSCSIVIENMNVTDLSQAQEWEKIMVEIIDKHPHAKLIVIL